METCFSEIEILKFWNSSPLLPSSPSSLSLLEDIRRLREDIVVTYYVHKWVETNQKNMSEVIKMKLNIKN